MTVKTPHEIEKQLKENRELLAVAAAERSARRKAALQAKESLRRAQLLIRRAAGHTA